MKHGVSIKLKIDLKKTVLRMRKMPFASTTPPRSAFEIFRDDKKSSYEKKYPNANPTQIEKMLNNAWEKLPLVERDRYFGLSKDEIESYQSSYYF